MVTSVKSVSITTRISFTEIGSMAARIPGTQTLDCSPSDRNMVSLVQDEKWILEGENHQNWVRKAEITPDNQYRKKFILGK